MPDSVVQYFAMGGYAGFVWPAYAISTVVMIALAVFVFRGLKVREKTLKILREKSGQLR